MFRWYREKNIVCCRVRADSQSFWSWALLQICIRISLSTLMWIRIWFFTLMRFRISTYPAPAARQLVYRPSTTPFWASKSLFWASTALYSIAKVVFEHPLSTAPEFGLWCVSRSGVTWSLQGYNLLFTYFNLSRWPFYFVPSGHLAYTLGEFIYQCRSGLVKFLYQWCKLAVKP